MDEQTQTPEQQSVQTIPLLLHILPDGRVVRVEGPLRNRDLCLRALANALSFVLNLNTEELAPKILTAQAVPPRVPINRLRNGN